MFNIAFAEATLFSVSCVSSLCLYFALVNDLYISDPLKANKTQEICIFMERLDCLIMCTFYSPCTRVILLCTNVNRCVQNAFRYEHNVFRYVHNVFRYAQNIFRYMHNVFRYVQNVFRSVH